MDGATHKKISFHELMYYSVDPGGSQHDPYQRNQLFGYFPTPEDADHHAEEMNLGRKLTDGEIHPPLSLRWDGDRRRAKPFLIGYRVKQVEGFTSDDGKTFKYDGQTIHVERNIVRRRVEEDDRSMVYRRMMEKHQK